MTSADRFGKNMLQNNTIIRVKRLFSDFFSEEKIRYIKIHGSQYQESGLPDLIILIGNQYKLWIEVKRGWKDEPSKLQVHNIKDLRLHGFITAYAVGDRFKFNWTDKKELEFWEFIEVVRHGG